MNVIERAEQRLKEEERQNRLGADNDDTLRYWAAYLDGARAQMKENEFEQTYEPADASASPWHRVEDGLPDKYTQCLLADADGKCAVGYYRYDCKAWDNPAFGWIEMENRIYIDDMPMGIGKVVAWMPIEPPKEDA